MISLVEILPGYIGIKGYADWAESSCGMERKDEDNFMPTIVCRRDYGTVDTAGVFH